MCQSMPAWSTFASVGCHGSGSERAALKKVHGRQRCGSADRTLPLPSFSPLLVELEIAPSGIAGKAGVVRVLQSIALHTRSDQPTSGRPPGGLNDQPLIDPTSKKAVGFDPNGIDPEGMVRLRNGSFWIAEEYAPSLLEVSAEGRVLSRFIPFGQRLPVADSDVRGVLPAAYACRRDNRGFESLGCSPDESLLYCLLQSPIELPNVKKGPAWERAAPRV